MTSILPIAEFAPDMPILSNGSSTVLNVLPRTETSYGPIRSLVADLPPGGLDLNNSLNGTCIGAFQCQDTDLSVHLFSGTSDSLYKRDFGAKNWPIVNQSGHIYATNIGDNWNFTLYNRTVIATNLLIPMQAYTLGIDTLFSDLTGTVQARHITTTKEFVVVGNTFDSIGGLAPGRIWWCGQGDPTNWPPPGSDAAQQAMSDYNDFPGTQGDITALASNLNGCDLVIFFRHAVWRGFFVGPPDVFDFYPAESVRGCSAPNSAVTVGGVVYYLGEDGFYAYDGNNSVPIGVNKVDKWFINDVDHSLLYKVVGAVDVANKVIFWNYASTQAVGGRPDKMIIFRMDLGRWSLMTIGVEWVLKQQAFSFIPQNLIISNINSDIELATIQTNGTLSYFTGPYLEPYIGTNTVQTFQGGRALIRSIRPLVDGGTNAVFAAVASQEDLYDAPTLSPQVTQNIAGEFPVRSEGRFHTFYVGIPAGTNWSHIEGFEIDAIQTGDRGRQKQTPQALNRPGYVTQFVNGEYMLTDDGQFATTDDGQKIIVSFPISPPLRLISTPTTPTPTSTNQPPPLAVTQISLVNATATSLQMSWTDTNTAGSVTYKILYKLHTDTSYGNFINNVSPGLVLPNLMPDKTYDIAVVVFDNLNQSSAIVASGPWSTNATDTPVNNESPTGTFVQTIGPVIIDSTGESFALITNGSGFLITVNGTPDLTAENPQYIIYSAHRIWYKDATTGKIYAKTTSGDAWDQWTDVNGFPVEGASGPPPVLAPAPGVVTNLQLINFNSTSLELAWTPGSGSGPFSWTLQYRQHGSTLWSSPALLTQTVNQPSFTFSSLFADARWDFQIIQIDQYGQSGTPLLTGPWATSATAVPPPNGQESVNGFTATGTATITDSVGEKWGVVGTVPNYRVTINGVVDGSASAAQNIVYADRRVWYIENGTGNTYVKTTSVDPQWDRWTTISGVPIYGAPAPVPASPLSTPTPPPTTTESVQGTALTGIGGTIIDGSGNVYALAPAAAGLSGLGITFNGQMLPLTQQTTLLLYWNHTVYTQNASGDWYSIIGTVGAATTDPRSGTGSTSGESASGASLTSTSGSLTDSAGNIYALTPAIAPLTGLAITFNSIPLPDTQNTTILLYYNHIIYTQNTAGDWFSIVGSTGNAVSGDPRNTVVSQPASGQGTAAGLLAYLQNNVYQQGLMSGQYAGTIGGSGDYSEFDQILQLTGKYPAVWGADPYYYNAPSSVAPDYSKILVAHRTQTQRGGFTTINIHMPNPVDGTGVDTTQNPGSQTLRRMVTPGDSQNTALNAILDAQIPGLKAIGAIAPFIFRPWHESVGTWFWWGQQNGATPQDWLNFWLYTKARYNSQGALNCIWNCAAPAAFPNPGDYDLATWDCYGPPSQYVDTYNQCVATGKMTAYSEWGPSLNTDDTPGYDMSQLAGEMRSQPKNLYLMNWGEGGGAIGWGLLQVQNARAFMQDPWIKNAGDFGAWFTATPTPTPTVPTPTPVVTPSANFKVSGGKIFKPNGSQWMGRGVNIPSDKMGPGQANLLRLLPGTNIIRMPAGSSPQDGYQNPAYYSTFINWATSNNIVVIVEDHPFPSPPPYTGSALTAELNWYRDIAAYYSNNPLVWFGTMNEPSPGPDDGYYSNNIDIQNQEVAIYNAIRGTGNNNMVLFQAGVGSVNPGTVGSPGFNAAAFSGMNNVAWEQHFYGWITQNLLGTFSTDQTAVNGCVTGSADTHTGILGSQNIQSADGIMPVFFGEFSGQASDTSNVPNATQVINAVTGVGVSVGQAGYTAWSWNSDSASQITPDSGNTLTSWGTTLAGKIATTAAQYP